MRFDSHNDRLIRGGTPLEETPAWRALDEHFARVGDLEMGRLFDEDPDRFERFSVDLGDMLFDYSKNRMTTETVSLLGDLAEASAAHFLIVHIDVENLAIL